MRINTEVKNRVEQYEYKREINYAKSDGTLFKSLKIIYTCFFGWTMIMNLLFISGWLLMSDTEGFKTIIESFYQIAAATAVLAVAFVFIWTKFKIVGLVLSYFPLVFSLPVFARLMTEDTARFGYKLSFYWRHLGPIAVMIVLLTVMIILFVREKVKFNKSYKIVVNSIYEEYMHIPAELRTVSWNEYLKNYCEQRIKSE